MRFTLAAVASIVMACGSLAQPAATPPPRCVDGRPPAEIDLALSRPAPYEPRSAAVACIRHATSDPPSFDRWYQLRDGRRLHVYERGEALPAKPRPTPLASGTAEVAGVTWRFVVLDLPTPLLELELARADLYIELDVPMRDRDTDLALLRLIAATMGVR